MLAPDQDTCQRAIEQSFSAASAITTYAGAIRYVVAPLDSSNFPAWFGPVRTIIATAVANATAWMDDVCIDTTNTIPRSVVDFSATFSTASRQLGNLQTEIALSSGVATLAQRDAAEAALQMLKTGVDKAQTAVEAVGGRLATLSKLMQNDHDGLATASALVAANIPNGANISSQIDASLGDDFLSITPSGPCLVAVNLEADVRMQITRTAGDHPELLPYVIAQRVLDNAVVDAARAAEAFSKLRSIWSLMNGLVRQTRADLAQAADDGVLPVLRTAQLVAARAVWDHLADLSKTLMNNS